MSSFNLFRVLGLDYEVFHTRMLCWLWTPNADHGAGDRFLAALLRTLEIEAPADCTIGAECKINVPGGPRWRIADILIRIPTHLILVENKVDPGYQDVEQVREEIAGGNVLAEAESRRFVYVLIAPGPISSVINAEVNVAGRFISWQQVVELIRMVRIHDLDPIVQNAICQYTDFMSRPTSVRVQKATDTLLADCETGIAELLAEIAPGDSVTAVGIWNRFTERFPDHVSLLDSRYADASHYSAKSWFSAKLQRMAATRTLIEDTGEWRKADIAWGYPKIRLYRRIAE